MLILVRLARLSMVNSFKIGKIVIWIQDCHRKWFRLEFISLSMSSDSTICCDYGIVFNRRGQRCNKMRTRPTRRYTQRVIVVLLMNHTNLITIQWYTNYSTHKPLQQLPQSLQQRWMTTGETMKTFEIKSLQDIAPESLKILIEKINWPARPSWTY